MELLFIMLNACGKLDTAMYYNKEGQAVVTHDRAKIPNEFMEEFLSKKNIFIVYEDKRDTCA